MIVLLMFWLTQDKQFHSFITPCLMWTNDHCPGFLTGQEVLHAVMRFFDNLKDKLKEVHGQWRFYGS